MFDCNVIEPNDAAALLTQDDLAALKAADPWSQRYFSRRDNAMVKNVIRNMVHELYKSGYVFCKMISLNDDDKEAGWCWGGVTEDEELGPLFGLEPVPHSQISLMVKPMLMIRNAYRDGYNDHKVYVKSQIMPLID